jgi:CheY-like chemotaxis protein
MYNILLVDDDPDVRKLVKKILEKSGYNVVAVDNGLSALSAINEHSYDLLLSDANMPQYSGFDLLKAVRRLPKHRDLAIAMLTGRREIDAIQKAVELGANDYIVKPVDPDVLISKIQKLIGHKFAGPAITALPESVDVNIEASLQCPLKLKKIGLDVFSATCPYPLNIGQDFYLNIDDLNYDVLPKARITSSNIDPSNSKQFVVHGVFLESDESFKKAIRELLKNKNTTAA